ncbi:family 20 glycosylhydrolase [uncultured Cyclobacterium sp.]|uniref:family 20 glycosylhydrolase n=1 Tax=uncultured Cyclobacterium sp. TaxID=453820 RepID=UPI0030EDCFF5
MNKITQIFTFLIIINGFISCQTSPNWNEAVENIYIDWELKTNFTAAEGQFEAVFGIENQSNYLLGEKDWALFFSMSPRGIVSTENADITHINGDWYKISPIKGFSLAPGERIEIPYVGIEGVIKETDAPMGMYFVFYEEDGESEEIVAVNNVKVKPFLEDRQRLRGTMDKEVPYSAESQFESNSQLVKLENEDLLPIIPTPFQVNKGEGNYTIEEALSIGFEKGLSNEAKYLRDKLSDLTGEKFSMEEVSGDHSGIVLKLSNIEVNEKKEEAYQLAIDPSGISISGSDPAGVFYGLQSLLALLGNEAYLNQKLPLTLPNIMIADAPRFGFRSLHMDVARNFQSKETIKKTLDIMSHYKLNHFLFYTTEDEGWRVEIPGLPELTEVGGQREHTQSMDDPVVHPGYGSGPFAYTEGKNGSGFYTREEFVDILEYAKARHITVIPVLNFPGHARAAIKSMEKRYLKLMEEGKKEEAEAYRLVDPEDQSEYMSAQSFKDNVVNVASASTYDFYLKVVDELSKMYDDAGLKLKKMHSGGDEVAEGAWTASPQAKKLLESLPEISDPKNLQTYFFSTLLDKLADRDLEMHVWEEMVLLKDESGVYKPNPEFADRNVVPYIWNNMFDYPDLGYQLANMGYEVVLCNVSNFYFDLAYSNDPEEPGLYWAGFVNTKNAWAFAPYDWFKTTYKTSMGEVIDREKDFNDMVRIDPAAKKNIIGLEAQLWSETVKGPEMAEYYMFPKMLGFAESAWAAERDWEKEPDLKKMDQKIMKGWNEFANRVGQTAFPKLKWWNGGLNYRVAPPGAKVLDGKLYANVNFPGLEIRYTTDGTEPTLTSAAYTGPIEIDKEVKLKVFDNTGKGSRSIVVNPKVWELRESK